MDDVSLDKMVLHRSTVPKAVIFFRSSEARDAGQSLLRSNKLKEFTCQRLHTTPLLSASFTSIIGGPLPTISISLAAIKARSASIEGSAPAMSRKYAASYHIHNFQTADDLITPPHCILADNIQEKAADSDSDNPKVIPDHLPHIDRALDSTDRERIVSKPVKEASETFSPRIKPSDNATPRTAGPSVSSYLKSPAPHLNPTSPGASAAPSINMNGEPEQLATKLFSDSALSQVGDPELLRDMSVLLPPPRPPLPGSSEAAPLWGLSSESNVFFPREGRATHEVSESVSQSVKRFHQLKKQGTHFNQSLMENRSFNNPHVYSQLVDFLEIDETRSNLPALDTGRSEGSWREIFPFSEEDLIRGDPVAAEQRQEREMSGSLARKKKAGLNRNIDFQKGRHDAGSKADGKRRSSTAHDTSQKRVR